MPWSRAEKRTGVTPVAPVDEPNSRHVLGPAPEGYPENRLLHARPVSYPLSRCLKLLGSGQPGGNSRVRRWGPDRPACRPFDSEDGTFRHAEPFRHPDRKAEIDVIRSSKDNANSGRSRDRLPKAACRAQFSWNVPSMGPAFLSCAPLDRICSNHLSRR